MQNRYKKRIADNVLKRKLAGKGAVLIEGAKWCGKTTTAEQIAASVKYMTETGMMDQNIQLASLNPKLLLNGIRPRLIDEWQIAPKIWDSIRFECDHGPLGQFILTGSSVPADMSNVFHSGTGRIGSIRMRPMSLWESQESTGEISLADLFSAPNQIGAINQLDLEKVAFLTCRGGWPLAVDLDPEVALDQAYDYIDAVEKHDIQRVDGVERDPIRVHRLLRSLARNQGSQASCNTIKKDLTANESDSLSEDTIASYIKALKEIFVVEDSEAWNPNLRSRTAIRTSDTRYFTDPSIAAAALGVGPKDLLNDLNTFGLLFETMAVRDLRVYAEAMFGKVYHFRDKNGLECDAVVHLRDGRYGLVEIKLGGDEMINNGAEVLKILARKIDTDKMKVPSFLMVLTGVGSYAYRRKDGVYVVPIGCLKD
ncbi:MAG: ATP-binding protein [Bacteroidales bacterium]|nr:ATP-binding protein [Bacteroidales bacterium]